MHQTDITFINIGDTSGAGMIAKRLRAAQAALRRWKLDSPGYGDSTLRIKGKVMMESGKKCCSQPAAAGSKRR